MIVKEKSIYIIGELAWAPQTWQGSLDKTLLFKPGAPLILWSYKAGSQGTERNVWRLLFI